MIPRRLRLFCVTASVSLAGLDAVAQVPAPPLGAGKPPVPATYQGPTSAIAAIVNDKVITTHDVQQRVRLMILGSGGAITQAMLPQVQQRALRDLVEEQLQFLEAERFEVKIEDKEVDEEFRNLAAQNGITPQELELKLKAAGISIEGVREQMRAGILWPRIVQGRFRNRVRIKDEEIEETLNRMRDEATHEQYLVSEICIPVADPSQAQELYQGSLNLIEQMRKGVPFAVVAQQFSACTSAAAGGDLGWVQAGELPAELDRVLKQIPVGAVSNPIPSEGALMILAVRDKREAQAAGEETFTLAYAGAPQSMGREAARTALEKLATAEACGGSLRQDLGPGVGVALLENIRMSSIDERFRDAIDGVGRGQLAPITEADDAFHAIYVCEKDEGLGLPSREAIKDRAYGRELSRLAQQYLRDLERKALVDIRLKTEVAPSG
jgi:peptidyl-prolyl cis-trans isomerase SurA